MDGMDEKKKKLHLQGSFHEGRDKAFMDVDRMINEGMSGGSVHARQDTTNIEEAHEFVNEESPNEN